MIASFRAEWLKFRTRPANLVLVLVLGGLMLILTYVLTYVILAHPPQGFRTQGGPPASVLGSEYAWLTWQTILVQKPRRLEVLAGKLLLLILVALVLDLAMFGTAALSSWALAAIDGSASSFASGATFVQAIAGGWLILSTYMVLGVALAVLFRGVAGSIGAGLTYVFVIEGLIGNLLRGVTGIKDVLKFLPGVSGSAIVAAFRSTVPGRNVAAPLVSAGRGTLTFAIYLAIFCIVPAVIVRRRGLA